MLRMPPCWATNKLILNLSVSIFLILNIFNKKIDSSLLIKADEV